MNPNAEPSPESTLRESLGRALAQHESEDYAEDWQRYDRLAQVAISHLLNTRAEPPGDEELTRIAADDDDVVVPLCGRPAEVTDEMVERACRFQFDAWDLPKTKMFRAAHEGWREKMRIETRAILKAALGVGAG